MYFSPHVLRFISGSKTFLIFMTARFPTV